MHASDAPLSVADTAADYEQEAAVAATEAFYLVAALPTSAALFVDGSFGRAVAVADGLVAVSAIQLADGQGVVQVCNSVAAGTSTNGYVWPAVECQLVTAPTADSLVPYSSLVALELAPAFGASLALYDNALAVGAPAAVATGAVFIYNLDFPASPAIVLADPDASITYAGSDGVTHGSGFGSVIAMSGGALVVANPQANAGRGRIYVFTWSIPDVPAGPVSAFVSWYEGAFAGAGLGSSLAMLPAAAYPLPDGVNELQRTLGLVVAGVTTVSGNDTASAALVFAVRADSSNVPWSKAGLNGAALPDVFPPLAGFVTLISDTSSDAINVLDQLWGFTSIANATLPADAASPSTVAAAGATVLLADPTANRWAGEGLPVPLFVDVDSGDEAALMAATGRLYQLSFCPRDTVRVRSTNPSAAVPYECRACPDGQHSFGGTSSLCTACTDGAVCAGAVDAYGHATDLVMSAIIPNANLTHGSYYVLAVRGVTEAATWRELVSSEFRVDLTPPVGGYIRDGVQTEVNYTSSADSFQAFWSGWKDPESGIDHYEYGASTVPCDGVFQRSCAPIHVNVNGTEGFHIVRQLCSDALLADRAALLSSAGLDPSLGGTAAEPLPFDPNTDFNIVPLQPVGTSRQVSVTIPDALSNGATVYSCIAAVNRAGLRTYASSAGVTIDTTPPTMLSVGNGVNPPSLSAQSYLDMFTMYFTAEDAESGIATYEWACTHDPTPVLEAQAAEAAGGTVDWTEVYNAINGSLCFPWEDAGWNEFSAKFNLHLTVGQTYYGMVRAHNGAGLVSRIMMANGIRVGKTQVPLANDTDNGLVVGFNTQNTANNPVLNNATTDRPAGITTGAMVVPPGAIPAGSASSVVAGLVDQQDVSSGSAVSADNTSAPTQNFHFGNYSFSE
jgi:hypothetical protein